MKNSNIFLLAFILIVSYLQAVSSCQNSTPPNMGVDQDTMLYIAWNKEKNIAFCGHRLQYGNIVAANGDIREGKQASGKYQYCIGISTDGQSYASIDGKHLLIRDITSGMISHNIKLDNDRRTARLTLGKNGTYLASSHERDVDVYSLVKDSFVFNCKLQVITTVNNCIISDDGNTLAVGGDKGDIEIWSIPDKKVLGKIAAIDKDTKQVTALAFTSDNKSLVVGCHCGHACRIMIHDMSIVAKRNLSSSITSCAIDSNNKYVSFGFYKNDMMLCKYESLEDPHIIDNLPSTPCSLSFSPSGSTVAISCIKGQVCLVDVLARKITWTVNTSEKK